MFNTKSQSTHDNDYTERQSHCYKFHKGVDKEKEQIFQPENDTLKSRILKIKQGKASFYIQLRTKIFVKRKRHDQKNFE